MAFLLLIHEPVGQRATRSLAEGEAVYERMLQFGRDLTARGLLLASESLATPDSSTARVRVCDGKPPHAPAAAAVAADSGRRRGERNRGIAEGAYRRCAPAARSDG